LKRTDEDVLADHKTILSYFSKTFDLTKTKLIPCIGNNDMFSHDELSMASKDKPSQTLLNDLSELWKPLKLNLTSSFSNGGYFVQQIPGGGPTIISLNSMYFYNKNTQVPDCDVAGSAGAVEMQWLEAQLQLAQQAHKKVYIMSHVPPVDKTDTLYNAKCYKQYVNILGKYSATIASHLTGHTNGKWRIQHIGLDITFYLQCIPLQMIISRCCTSKGAPTIWLAYRKRFT
jgi:hypothetical protein